LGGGDSDAAGTEGTGGQNKKTSTLTFLHGPHSCIGERFARAELMFLLAAWVSRWREMELEDPRREIVVDVASDVTARIRGGLRVRLREK
jgi:cytochrome P450